MAAQSSSNVLVTAIVPDGEKTFNGYVKDEDAIEACKSLKAAN